MKYAAQIRQTAKRMGVESKIENLYDLVAEDINLTYNRIRKEFNELEVELNSVLTSDMEDEETIKFCKHYISINCMLENMFDLVSNIEDKFKKEIYDISRIYIEATAMFSEGGMREGFGKSYCFVMKFRNDLYQWIQDFIILYIDELLEIHSKLEQGLEYVFNYIQELEEEENEELNEIIKDVKRLSYVSSSKDLQNTAIENGYEFKSQCGSHMKYEHRKSKKCVIIPLHNKDMGYGISMAIQKQILANAI